jgi:hypothetical protein
MQQEIEARDARIKILEEKVAAGAGAEVHLTSLIGMLLCVFELIPFDAWNSLPRLRRQTRRSKI